MTEPNDAADAARYRLIRDHFLKGWAIETSRDGFRTLIVEVVIPPFPLTPSQSVPMSAGTLNFILDALAEKGQPK